ncbi:glycosyl transferase [Vibrio zhanjiangensis]|uniref:Glycosyl transferase n=1 Tax=Vibrio zhanjiangensis TaxID=1046128 RepID=A0ABQ6F481_9VIBR|nr:glycosyltransferase [Vibrio zhanjiangensis]GLT20338.1 glycosyl transferase [Vibrio zhanjiangensis]
MIKKIDIIIPVYRGLQETRECIESACATKPEYADLIVINDCSPEPELTEWLEDNSARLGFSLHVNDCNLGFVATVNYGMSLHPENDVLLLNSDVEVANDWLERICDVAYTEKNIGSVTPFSNNATICSFPVFCENNGLAMGKSLQEIDKACSDANKVSDYVEIPTGVGFCMFIKRSCLNAVGLFDVETFGKGYGEENDWSQRASLLGWKNIHATNVFAYHKGGVSFANEQDSRQKTALELLLKKHPNYTADVMQFVSVDPAKRYRINVAIQLVKNSPKSILQVEHSLGGGVNRHVSDLVNKLQPDVVSVRLRQKNNVVTLLLTDSCSIKFDIGSDFSDLLYLLKYLNFSLIHFHHIHGLDEKFLNLSCSLCINYIISIHDYYLVNGNPALSDRDGKFFGDKDVSEVLERSSVNQLAGFKYNDKNGSERIKEFLSGAGALVFPSNDTKKRFGRFYQLSDTAIVAPHIEPYHYPPLSKEGIDICKVRILVIGAISLEKGAQILNDFANRYGDICEVHLLGSSCLPLAMTIIDHGPYGESELAAKVFDINPTAVWYTSQCAETYCYTLTPSMAMEIPIIAPRLGAFTERLNLYEKAIVIDDYSNIETVYQAAIEATEKNWVNDLTSSTTPMKESGFYENGYIAMVKSTVPNDLVLNDKALYSIMDKMNNYCDKKEKVYSLVLRFYRTGVGGKMLGLIPTRYLRACKRKLFG